MEFIELPRQYITAIRVVRPGPGTYARTLCKACYCMKYDMDETSISTATAQPQPDMTAEKHIALTTSSICNRCGKSIASVSTSHDVHLKIREYQAAIEK